MNITGYNKPFLTETFTSTLSKYELVYHLQAPETEKEPPASSYIFVSINENYN